MAVARVDTGQDVLTGEYEKGMIKIDETTYVIEDEEEMSLLTPCEPKAVYCLGRNYQNYIEMNTEVIENNLSHSAELPENVHFFLKGPTSVIGPGDPIPYPTFSDSVGYAGELAAVIDQTCKQVSPKHVSKIIRGYTIMNDIDSKDQPGITKTKVFDGSAPIGPAIADVDPTSLKMRTTINGEIRQDATTADMYRDPPEAISAISQRVTLHPGDIVAMGSPANPGTIEPGDDIEIWYEGIGTLQNTVCEYH